MVATMPAVPLSEQYQFGRCRCCWMPMTKFNQSNKWSKCRLNCANKMCFDALDALPPQEQQGIVEDNSKLLGPHSRGGDTATMMTGQFSCCIRTQQKKARAHFKTSAHQSLRIWGAHFLLILVQMKVWSPHGSCMIPNLHHGWYLLVLKMSSLSFCLSASLVLLFGSLC